MTLHGVLVTFNRPAALRESLARIAAQDVALDRLVVVDNGSSAESGQVLEDSPVQLEVVSPGENLGPAGGIALGMQRVLARAEPSDWIVLFDDDDPPPSPTTLSQLVALGEATAAREPSLAAVGLYGARFDPRRTRLLASSSLGGDNPVAVDYLASGWFPLYRVSALQRVGVFDERLFFGFDDLELGLRLRAAGFTLWADRDEGSRAGAGAPGTKPLVQAPWRRYYGTRNLVYLARRYYGPRVAAQVAVAYGVVSPVRSLLRREERGGQRAWLSVKAVRDGYLGRLGRTVPPA